jgi:RecB family exonuclease
VITPRTTRLVRTADLAAFRDAIATLATTGSPLDARNRLIVVPSHPAAAVLLQTIEARALHSAPALIRPDLVTARELPARLAERAAPHLVASRDEARDILMGVACRQAVEAGREPPFRLRAGLIAEVLSLYDALARRRKSIATFERLALGHLEPGAEYDRGAARLVRQTHFLVAAFRAFEQLCADRAIVDEHVLRRIAMETAASRPWRHVVVTVGDESRDPHGLWAADWDVLTRIPGLERLDLVVTDHVLAGAWHERVHQLLPGIEETRIESPLRPLPALRVPPRAAATSVHEASADSAAFVARDREDEIAAFARWTRELHRTTPALDLGRVALVVRHPLPYMYLAREVLRSANIPSQAFEVLPLAAEPYAAAFDLVCAAVTSQVSRTAGVALLSSPHFRWDVDGEPVTAEQIAAVDRLLAEHAYLGGRDSLHRLANALSGPASSSSSATHPFVPESDSDTPRRPQPALRALLAIADALDPLRTPAPAAEHLDRLLTFLERHSAMVADAGPWESRARRARAAIHGVLAVLRDEYRRFDAMPVDFEQVMAQVRRWIESHTFAPRTGSGGVQVLDAESAGFGDFDYVQLAGLVDGEWPDAPRRNVFYGPSILRDLGWSAEAERVDHVRASFVDLLTLPAAVLTVSTFNLEGDAPVAASSLLDLLDRFDTIRVPALTEQARIFESEVLGRDPVSLTGFDPALESTIEWRLRRPPASDQRFHGQLPPRPAGMLSLSGLERYQDCPFKFFATDVLRLGEIPEDQPFLSPRARGRFIHEVFQRFFAAWDGRGMPTMTADDLDEARALFVEVAEPMLATLNESDRALERARLLGSAVAMGMLDVVLGLEASRTDDVVERRLESSFEGRFSLGVDDGRRVALRGVVDRLDLLAGRRLRVVDYKTGQAPAPGRALQVPVYALCACEQLQARDGEPWAVADAAYIAFAGKRPLVSIVRDGETADEVLAAARERVLALVDDIAGGRFVPRPHETTLCRTCSYPSVCRKDYVDG